MAKVEVGAGRVGAVFNPERPLFTRRKRKPVLEFFFGNKVNKAFGKELEQSLSLFFATG